MGDLKGHAIPGSFFIFYGLWWAIGCLRKFFASRRDGTPYVSSATYALPYFNGRLRAIPAEGIFKTFLACTGVVGEWLDHLPLPPLPIVQHMTMYFFFILSGVVDISVHYGLPLPPGVDYMSLTMALFVEGMLFANHIHGREELDIKLHLLLVYVIFASVVVTALEAKFQHSVILSLGRGYLTMLQGTWFWAVGIILYTHGDPNTAWDLESPMSNMQATIYFTWHCAVNFILLIIITIVMSCFYRRKGGSLKQMISLSEMGRGKASESKAEYGMLAIADLDDNDSDVEFDQSDVPLNR